MSPDCTKLRELSTEGEKDTTYGFLQSIGLWTVKTYLQEDISFIELINTVGSEQTNLTCRKKAGWVQSNTLINRRTP